MSKLFFRFLRGEINGFYLTRFHNAVNVFTKDVRDFFISFRTMQFNNEMSLDTLFGIGKFASVFIPNYTTEEQTYALTFSDSHVVGGTEYSERGLYNTDEERFEFRHTTQEEGLPDIDTLATPSLRSSLVGDEQVQGYIPSSATDVLDENGNVRASKVLPSPPSGEAYSEFYGNEFLFLSEGAGTTHYKSLSPDLYIDIYKTLQWIRYNGVSLESLLHITEVLCPEGFVRIKGIELAEDNLHFQITYVTDEGSAVTDKAQRLFLLEYLIRLKFKQYSIKSEQ
jgi:hypothetical protein